MRTLISTISLLSSAALIACGGGDSGDDGITTVDANNNQIDAAAAACTVSSDSLGDLGAFQGQSFFDPGQMMNDATDDYAEFDAVLEGSDPSDVAIVSLYAGYGAFSGGAIVPGTYEITGDELDFATCGVCVDILTNAASAGGYDDDYFATGGTVTITTVPAAVGDMLVGSVSNLTFHHANISMDDGSTTQAADSCTTSISNGTFSATTMAVPQQ